MLFLNALTSLQVGIFGALAAVAAPDADAATEAVESAEPAEAAPEADFDIADAVDPSERPRRWECWDYGERERRGWCLARCTDSWRYRPVTSRIRVRGNRDYCASRARRYCRQRDERVRDWCFGERD